MKFGKFLFTVFSVLTLLLSLASCMMFNNKIDVSDEIVECQMAAGQIKAIHASSDLIVIVSPLKNSGAIVARAPENVMKTLDWTYDDQGILSLSLTGMERFRYRSDKQKAHIYIFSDCISNLVASSGAKIEVTDSLSCETTLKVEAMSGGSIRLDNIESPYINIKSFSGGCVLMDNIVAERLNVQSFTGGVIQVSGITNSIQTKGDSFLINTGNLNIGN